MELHKKVEERQVDHFGELLRLGQQQCHLLRLLVDWLISSDRPATPL
jgi:hypothetical protein